jgi:hypothetical protein
LAGKARGQPTSVSSGTRLLIGFTLATALVVGAVVSLATGDWWFLLLALGAHLLGTVAVLASVGSRLRQQDKPDAVTEARLAEQGDEGERPRLAG